MIQLKGIAWDHPRGYEPLKTVSQIFMQDNPYVDIHWDTRSLKEFGDMPIEDLICRYDLITIDHPYIGQAHHERLLLKLDNYIAKNKLNILKKDGLGSCFDSYSCEGHMYALPIDASAQMASFRKDLMVEFGLTVPKSYEELKALYKKVPKKFSVAWPLCPTDLWCSFLTLCAQRIGNGFIKGRVFDQKLGGEILDEIKVHLDFLHPKSIEWNPIQVLDEMADNDQILYSPYLFGYTNYSRQGYTKNIIHFTHSPKGHQKDVSTLLGGVGLASSAKTDFPEITSKFIEFVAGEKIQKTYYLVNAGQPASKSTWKNNYANTWCNDFFKNTISTIEEAYIRPRHHGWNDFQEKAAELLHDGILKNACSYKLMNDLNELYKF